MQYILNAVHASKVLLIVQESYLRKILIHRAQILKTHVLHLQLFVVRRSIVETVVVIAEIVHDIL
jgi:hypothetical protein